MRAVSLPFHPDDASFNRGNALYLAHASDVAYHRRPGPAALDRLGLETLAFHHKVTRTRGYLGLCDTHAVLAFRGSDPVTAASWVTDVVVRLVERPDYQGRVHLGFSSALRRTWGKVSAVLDAVGDKPLFLTGHSMGGALAVLTAWRLAKLGRPPVATYTFGAPRVGRSHVLRRLRLAHVQGRQPAGPRARAADGVAEAAAAGQAAVHQRAGPGPPPPDWPTGCRATAT